MKDTISELVAGIRWFEQEGNYDEVRARWPKLIKAALNDRRLFESQLAFAGAIGVTGNQIGRWADGGSMPAKVVRAYVYKLLIKRTETRL